MALEFLYPLSKLNPELFGVLNVIYYITFRAAMAAITAMVIGVLAGPYMIDWLVRMKIGQTIRGEGVKDLYERHKGKAGTPTMGGTLILASITVSMFLWGNWHNELVWTCLLVTWALGALGFLDDYTKLKEKKYKGVHAKQKLIVQISIGLAVGVMLYCFHPLGDNRPYDLPMPFLKNVFIPLGMFYIPFVALVITGASNAVNLTDGLDGLASGCIIVASLAFAALCYIVGRFDYSAYLGILFVKESGELAVFAMALVGATMAFLWYNAHPAKVFMGDTGSLALGGALGTLAVLIKQELVLVIIGGVFVMEAMSVILQVTSYRYRGGKRIFLMAPLHHHFEMKGWSETTIVVRFWILAAIFAFMGLATLKIR
ncbi:MAG: phospho-N-acetylmuramoyl-pentapeptide-transferase [bacterium]|jgi:phospho-N-acetylmuramoyl-pentapeptide-transferase|nr:phospho-N-acetylmuramoyl-pentapeptide-transferase [bacterium]